MRLRATVRVRNDKMLSARERLGLSQRALAELAGVPTTVVGALESMRYHWLGRAAYERARAVAVELGIAPEDVLPLELEGKNACLDAVRLVDASPNALGTASMNNPRLIAMAPDDVLAAKEDTAIFLSRAEAAFLHRPRMYGCRRHEVRDWKCKDCCITDKNVAARNRILAIEWDVLRRLFGIGRDEQTLEEAGRDLKLSRERIRQMRVSALNHAASCLRTEGSDK